MILVCPTAFKGTLPATAVAAAMAEGARMAAPDVPIRSLPLSDGGNGLLDAVAAARGGTERAVTVVGPMGAAVRARFRSQGPEAIVETAEACGLHLVPAAERDPLRADTRGVGQLLLAAAGGAGVVGAGGGGPACGARVAADRLVVGLGGSATVDAGAGMAAVLGWRLLDADGRPLPPGAGALARLHAIEPPREPPLLPVLLVLADVNNPLLGPDGAARVFGPQKGATPEVVERIEAGHGRWAEVVERDLGRRVATLPGAGAAGGLGAAFAALLDSPPTPGAGWVLDAVGFDAALAGATAVVTGEGAWDRQSSMGKVTGEVVARAVAAGVPALLVAGSIDGRLPRGVEGVAGGGGTMDAAEIRDRVSSRVGALLRPGAGP